MDKRAYIRNWLHTPNRSKQFGALHLTDNKVYTYAVLLGVVNRETKTLHLNGATYSHTSTVHRGLLHSAANFEGYSVTEHSEESSLFGLA